MAEEIIQLDINQLQPNPLQPRGAITPESLVDLVDSIREHGILEPLVIAKTPAGFQIIAGERRWRASKLAGLTHVPVIIRETTPKGMLEMAIVENVQRVDLNALDRAKGFERLMDEFGLTQEDVSHQVGKSRPTVANMVRLLDLPEPIQKSLMDGQLSVGKAKALLSLASPKEQLEMFKSMTGEKMTVRDLEHHVAMQPATSRKGFVRRDPNVMAQEKLLEERLGTKVYITQKGQSGKITIEYYSQEDLKRLISELS